MSRRVPLLALLVVLLAGLWPSAVLAGQRPQVIEVRVSTWPRELELADCSVSIDAGGEKVTAPLERHGYLGQKASRPGLWYATFEGPPKRLAEVALTIDRQGETVALWKRMVQFDDPEFSTLSLRVDVDRDQLRVTRTFWIAYEGSPDRRVGKVALLIAFGWGGLAVLYVGLVVRRARR